MGELKPRPDEVARALQSLRRTVGGNSWATATVDAALRRMRAAVEIDEAVDLAAAKEIHRLAGLRIEGSLDYTPDEWCPHGGRNPTDRTDSATRLKLECLRCIAEIITGTDDPAEAEG